MKLIYLKTSFDSCFMDTLLCLVHIQSAILKMIWELLLHSDSGMTSLLADLRSIFGAHVVHDINDGIVHSFSNHFHSFRSDFTEKTWRDTYVYNIYNHNPNTLAIFLVCVCAVHICS